MENPAERRSIRSRNSFDLLRLIAAAAVLWSHQHALLQLPEPMFPGLAATFGGFGVYIFFAISGYLNAGSLLRGRSVTTFLFNRVLRIYPALIACTIFMVCLGAAVTTLPLKKYLLDGSVSAFTLRNMTLIGGVTSNLPGVFETNPYPRAMNGSLWTLPYEMDLYIVLAVVLAVWRYRTRAIYGLFALAVVYVAVFAAGPDTRRLLPGVLVGHLATFATLFLAGALIACCERDRSFALGPALCFGIGAIALMASGTALGRLLCFAALVVVCGRFALPAWLTPKIDLSYGIYLYAFPVQQVVASVTTDFWVALAASSIATVALAFASNQLIEARALRLKARVRKSQHGQPSSDVVLEMHS